MWLCLCECGEQTIVAGNNLTNGHTTACGAKHHNRNYHGKTGTELYHVWENMKARCSNPKHPSYADYGGRGIAMCREWMNFRNFEKDMAGSFKAGLTIDRKNNNAGYSKENCRWITQAEQVNNTRANRNFTFNGETKNIAQWARAKNISKSTLTYRLNKGWEMAEALRV